MKVTDVKWKEEELLLISFCNLFFLSSMISQFHTNCCKVTLKVVMFYD